MFKCVVEGLCGRFPVEGLPGPGIQRMRDRDQFIGSVHAEVSAFGKVLPQQAVDLFVSSTLPRALRVTEVDIESCVDPQPFMLRHLRAPILGQRPSTFGIDIGKRVFRVVALNAAGGIIQRAKFSHDTLMALFETAPKALVGMEACPGSQWLARRRTMMGHDTRIIPARFVKPYIKSNKTDMVTKMSPARDGSTSIRSRWVTVASE